MSEKIIGMVAKLLAQAEHPNTGDAERDAFLAKADELMAKHMIDEALIRAAQSPEQRRKPVVVEVSEMFDRTSIYGQKMQLIASQIADTVGVRMQVHYSGGRRVTLVGFDEDVRWMQMLFMNIQMAFLTKISPKWDNERDFVLNLVLLRESGLPWSRVLDRAVRAGAIEDTWSHVRATITESGQYWDSEKARWSAEDKLNRAYRNHCKAVGVAPVQINRHEAYRHTYAEAFTARICARLEDMKEARRTAQGPGTELVLRKVQEDVDEAFWCAFPDEHPDRIAERMAEARRQRELAREKHIEWLASLTPAARLRYEKEQTAKREKAARQNERYWRQLDREESARYDGNGYAAGRAAADGINLSTSENVGTANRKAL